MPCDVIRRYLTAFHKMFKIKSEIVSHMLVHLQAKFGSVWANFYLFMTSNVHPFFTTIFFIPCCIWSPIFKLLLFLSHSSVLYKWPLVRKLCYSLWVFYVLDVCIRQRIYLWAKHLCIHNLLNYHVSCSDDQCINSYHKMSISYNSRNLMVNYADVMRKFV